MPLTGKLWARKPLHVALIELLPPLEPKDATAAAEMKKHEDAIVALARGDEFNQISAAVRRLHTDFAQAWGVSMQALMLKEPQLSFDEVAERTLDYLDPNKEEDEQNHVCTSAEYLSARWRYGSQLHKWWIRTKEQQPA